MNSQTEPQNIPGFDETEAKRKPGFNTRDLHTKELERVFGPVHIDLESLIHDQEMRAANIVDGNGITRTRAVTLFRRDTWTPEIEEIDEEIKSGGAIGKTFEKYGYEIRKNVIAVYPMEIPDRLQQLFATRENKAKVRISEFFAKKAGSEPIIYGEVAEVYPPGFRAAEPLDRDYIQVRPTTRALAEIGIDKDKIWEKLGKDQENFDWGTLSEQYQSAQESSVEEVEAIRNRIEQFI